MSDMRGWLLDRVPIWFRRRWPLKRFYWQKAELEAAEVEGERLYRFLNRLDD